MKYTHIKPIKRIVSPSDLQRWTDSQTYTELVDFIQNLQDLVVGLTNNAEVPVSNNTEKLLSVLHKVSAIIDSNPVVKEADVSRFGKPEFRDFYDQLAAESRQLLSVFTQDEGALDELSTYFVESWGDRTRIDYGSGHELNFVCFLLVLQRLGVLAQPDYPAVILKGFTSYIAIMRKLQKLYWLEPAGSHGVWGLDDYHFLPFLFGASQLATHPHMKPKLIHIPELVETYYKQYMYLECIHFINTIKTTPQNGDQKLSLRWHSPMLDDILAANSWQKIKDGMVKMYKAEVLNKLPIIQHFLFGGVISAPEGVSDPSEHHEDDSCGHVHGHELANTWGDCCGIKIPSAIAASEMNQKMNQAHNYKPVPFD